MKILMKQRQIKLVHQYDFFINDILEFFVKTRRVFALKPRIIIIKSCTCSNEYHIKERNFFIRTLLRIPILSYILFFAYFKNITYKCFDITKNNMHFGSLIKVANIYELLFSFENHDYYVYEHRMGFQGVQFEVFLNDIKVGLIKRSTVKNWNASTYTAEFKDSLPKDVVIIIMTLTEVYTNLKDFHSKINFVSVEYEKDLF